MRKGSKHLRIASFLEILLGVGSIALIRLLLGFDQSAEGVSTSALEGALFGVIGLYAMNGFKILTGLAGLFLSNKKSLLTVVLGFLIILVQLVGFLQIGNGLPEILVNIVLLIIPYYYFHNALKNYRA